MTESRTSQMKNVDVLIIGAGISGIGAAYHLQKYCPQLSLAIVEARAELGGTWDLFKYPGIRSDSDLFTFGYDFNPWQDDQGIADGPSIKAYIRDTAKRFQINDKIHFNHRVVKLNWLSTKQRWQVFLRHEEETQATEVEARWIFNASGYYRYDRGYAPTFANQQAFKGTIVHPQHWPEDLDYRNKRVVVIGSGATAVTLIPAMAEQTAHITMLQRTPTYVLPVPAKDTVAKSLRPWLGDKLAFRLARRFNIAKQAWFYRFCMRFPRRARALIRWVNRKMLPEGYPVDVHFNPPYNPWQQRICAVPGGDLFKVISEGKASVVTEQIDKFTATGVRLVSGEQLEADIIVTATGLNLSPLGGLIPNIDGNPVSLPDCVIYKGTLLSGIPNFAIAVGYTSSSWTLKIGLLCTYFTRLLNHMSQHQLAVCTPKADPEMTTQPLLNFGAGYIQRSASQLPRQGDRFPWSMSWNYSDDVKVLQKGQIEDVNLAFSPRRPRVDQG